MGATCADSATNSINVVRGTIPAHHARAPRASSVVATCTLRQILKLLSNELSDVKKDRDALRSRAL